MLLKTYCPENKIIEKHRYVIEKANIIKDPNNVLLDGTNSENEPMHWKSPKWEVNFYNGLNIGIVVAEIELNTPYQHFETPSWIDRELGEQEAKKYDNYHLFKNPYKWWPLVGMK